MSERARLRKVEAQCAALIEQVARLSKNMVKMAQVSNNESKVLLSIMDKAQEVEVRFKEVPSVVADISLRVVDIAMRVSDIEAGNNIGIQTLEARVKALEAKPKPRKKSAAKNP